MEDILKRIETCIETGKIDKNSPFPPSMKGKDGADELTKQALESGISPNDILEKACVPGMETVGNKFSRNEIFVPQLLLSAKAMYGAMNHIKPYFKSGLLQRKGKFIIGTVHGDLHDIGKNIVAMIIEGGGWEVIDLGVDVKTEKFISTVEENPGSAIGLSSLLTTTMKNMETIVHELKNKYSDILVLIGGAPVTQDFCNNIGANFYSPDPQGAVEYLKNVS